MGNYWSITGGDSYLGGVGGVGVYMHGGTLTNEFIGAQHRHPKVAESETGSGSGGIGVYMNGGTLNNYSSSSIGGGTALDGAAGRTGVLLKSTATINNSGNVAGGYTYSGHGGVGLDIETSGPGREYIHCPHWRWWVVHEVRAGWALIWLAMPS